MKTQLKATPLKTNFKKPAQPKPYKKVARLNDLADIHALTDYAKAKGADDILTTYVYSGGTDLEFAKRKHELRKKFPEIAAAYDKQMGWNIDPNVKAYLDSTGEPLKSFAMAIAMIVAVFMVCCLVYGEGFVNDVGGKVSDFHRPTHEQVKA